MHNRKTAYSLVLFSHNLHSFVLDLNDGGAAHFAETVRQIKNE